MYFVNNSLMRYTNVVTSILRNTPLCTYYILFTYYLQLCKWIYHIQFEAI